MSTSSVLGLVGGEEGRKASETTRGQGSVEPGEWGAWVMSVKGSLIRTRGFGTHGEGMVA